MKAELIEKENELEQIYDVAENLESELLMFKD